MPSGRILATGYGCGSKLFQNYPNALRAILIESENEEEAQSDSDRICALESDMDHVSAEIMAFAAEELFSRGALDVSWVPVFMKKGRPGYRICCICRENQASELADCIIRQTRTLGVRVSFLNRIVARRNSRKEKWQGAIIDVKECTHRGFSFTKPEYECMAKLARERGVALIDLLEQYSRESQNG
jgi:hypothetical protein